MKVDAAAVTYLQYNLLFKVSLIKHDWYLHTEKKSDSNSTSAISNLCFTVRNCLKNVIQNVFALNQGELFEELCDKIRTQWKIYQCESIPLEFFQKPESLSATESKSTPNSYWKAAFHAFRIETTKDETTNLKRWVLEVSRQNERWKRAVEVSATACIGQMCTVH